MPAFESRRVRTQPFTVTGASCGALPDKIVRTLNTLSSIARELSWSSVKSQLNGSKRPNYFGRAAARPADAHAPEHLEVAVRRCGMVAPALTQLRTKVRKRAPRVRQAPAIILSARARRRAHRRPVDRRAWTEVYVTPVTEAGQIHERHLDVPLR